jgi:23S rRNA (pseudouridine1915-N3)-methyltransferase
MSDEKRLHHPVTLLYRTATGPQAEWERRHAALQPRRGTNMLNVTLICVGKLKEKFYIAAVEEYRKRLRAHCRLEILELPEERLPDGPSQALIDGALDREADRILARVPRNAALVALCVEGKLLSSEELAKQFNTFAVGGDSALCFVIGGSFGLHERVKRAARLRLSMSPMTFPHHLARVMVLEQIYRAFQISAGTKYHK